MTEVKAQLTQHLSTHPPTDPNSPSREEDLPKKVKTLESKMGTLHQRLLEIEGRIGNLDNEDGSGLPQLAHPQTIERLNKDLMTTKTEILSINQALERVKRDVRKI